MAQALDEVVLVTGANAWSSDRPRNETTVFRFQCVRLSILLVSVRLESTNLFWHLGGDATCELSRFIMGYEGQATNRSFTMHSSHFGNGCGFAV